MDESGFARIDTDFLFFSGASGNRLNGSLCLPIVSCSIFRGAQDESLIQRFLLCISARSAPLRGKTTANTDETDDPDGHGYEL